MTEAWEQLSLYESKDLISAFYEDFHGGDITADKAKEINSHLAQGREFISRARQTSELIRPLLLYYGVLSLSRGLILFLDPFSREDTISNSHGLGFDWQRDRNRVDTLRNISRLKVKPQEGTFSELGRVAENIERNAIPLYGSPGEQHVSQAGTKDVASDSTTTLEEILSQVPDLQRLFERTFAKLSNCYPGEVCYLGFSYDHHSCGVHIIETDLGHLPTEEQVREAFDLPPDTNVYVENIYNPWCDNASIEARNLRFEVRSTSETDLLKNIPLRTARNKLEMLPIPY